MRISQARDAARQWVIDEASGDNLADPLPGQIISMGQPLNNFYSSIPVQERQS